MVGRLLNLALRCSYVPGAILIFTIWVWGAETPDVSLNGDPRSNLSDLIYGNAHKPFVQRMLVPFTTRTIYSALAGDRVDKIEAALLEIPKVRKEVGRLQWEPEFLTEYLIALSLALAALLACVFVIKELWKTFYQTSEIATGIVPLAFLIGLPPFFLTGTHYIYDFPALLFFNLGFLLMIREKWAWFYCVFLIGCLNKETMIFLSLGFLLIYFDKLTVKHALKHLSGQILIFLSTRILLAAMFSSNPGSVTEFHLFANLHTLLMGYDLETLVLAVLIVGLALHNISQKHIFLRRTMWLSAPYAVVVLFFGIVAEVRSWLELYPILLFLILHTLLFDVLKVPFTRNALPDTSFTIS